MRWGVLLVCVTYFMCDRGGQVFAADGETERGGSPYLDSRQGHVLWSPTQTPKRGYTREVVQRQVSPSIRAQDDGQQGFYWLRQVSPSAREVTFRPQDGDLQQVSYWLRQASQVKRSAQDLSTTSRRRPSSSSYVITPEVSSLSATPQQTTCRYLSQLIRSLHQVDSSNQYIPTVDKHTNVEPLILQVEEIQEPTVRKKYLPSVETQPISQLNDVSLQELLHHQPLSLLHTSETNEQPAVSSQEFYHQPLSLLHTSETSEQPAISSQEFYHQPLSLLHTSETNEQPDVSSQEFYHQPLSLLYTSETYEQPAVSSQEFYHQPLSLLHTSETYEQPAVSSQEFYHQPLSLLHTSETNEQPAVSSQEFYDQPMSLLHTSETYEQPAVSSQEFYHQPLSLLHTSETYEQPAVSSQEFYHQPMSLLHTSETYEQPAVSSQEFYHQPMVSLLRQVESFDQPLQQFDQQPHVIQQVTDLPSTEHLTDLVQDDGLYQQLPQLVQEARIEEMSFPSPRNAKPFLRPRRIEGAKRQIRIHQCYFNPVSCF